MKLFDFHALFTPDSTPRFILIKGHVGDSMPRQLRPGFLSSAYLPRFKMLVPNQYRSQDLYLGV